MTGSKIKINPKDHVLVTAPDRFFEDALVVLLVDWPADLVDQALNALRGSQSRIAIHIFDFNDSNYQWLLDVTNQADVVSVNLNNINHIDLFKGHLIAKEKTFYFGRLGINKIFTNFSDDPIGTLLVRVGNKLSQMEEK